MSSTDRTPRLGIRANLAQFRLRVPGMTASLCASAALTFASALLVQFRMRESY
jgi:hypothetical protein